MTSSLPLVTSTSECSQYPNKRCRYPRTTKRDGGLHRFCALHRDNANRNQKRWLHAKRRKFMKPQDPSENPSKAQENIETQDAEPLWSEWLTGLDIDTLEFDNQSDHLESDAVLEWIDELLVGTL